MSAKAQAIKMVVALLMGGVSAVSAREPRVLDLQGVEFHNPTGKSASFAAGGEKRGQKKGVRRRFMTKGA